MLSISISIHSSSCSMYQCHSALDVVSATMFNDTLYSSHSKWSVCQCQIPIISTRQKYFKSSAESRSVTVLMSRPNSCYPISLPYSKWTLYYKTLKHVSSYLIEISNTNVYEIFPVFQTLCVHFSCEKRRNKVQSYVQYFYHEIMRWLLTANMIMIQMKLQLDFWCFGSIFRSMLIFFPPRGAEAAIISWNPRLFLSAKFTYLKECLCLALLYPVLNIQCK
jgi:hypothetical protein